MLTETRQEEILRLLTLKGSVTVQELKEYFDASESTIRRDLNTLDEKGALVKVFGGAMLAESNLATKDEQVSQRKGLYQDEKQQIGEYAASLIEPHDFVYLDAGTTTACMIPYITEKTATFVTNAVSHALELAGKGFHVIILGGELKAATEAIVGNEACMSLQKFNFTKCFMGANGASPAVVFTTPEINEAKIKECAMTHSLKSYVLCDSTKFHQVNPIRFGTFESAQIITEKLPDVVLKRYTNIIVVS